jgi:protein-tyrosine phosphatase
MACRIYTVQIEGKTKLGYMARPRGGEWLEDDLRSISQQRFDIVVSLLEDEEAEELALTDEAGLCTRHGLQFVRIPIRDRGVPAFDDVRMRALASLRELWRNGKAIVTHCRMGYGRAPMIAACILISKECGSNAAFEKLSAARGISVPETDEQRAWVQKYAELLGKEENSI